MNFAKLIKKNIKTLNSKTKNILENPFKNIPTIEDAIEISKKYNIALHPRYLFYWNELEASNLIIFLEFLKKIKIKFTPDSKIKFSYFPISNEVKKIFEKLGVEHSIKTISIEKVKSEKEINLIILNSLNTKILLSNLGFNDFKLPINYSEIISKKLEKIIKFSQKNLTKTSCEILSNNSKIEIRDKGGTYIGARMGRPEKAKMRKQFNDETRSHGLFPVEEIGGRTKNIVDVLKNSGFVNSEFRIYYCKKCNKDSIYSKCEICGEKTEQKKFEKYTGIEKENDNKDENNVY